MDTLLTEYSLFLFFLLSSLGSWNDGSNGPRKGKQSKQVKLKLKGSGQKRPPGFMEQ